MFQPRTTGSVENSKRRHRAGSDGSVKPPKAKRHRTLRQEKGESSPDIAGDVQQESELGEVAGMPESGKPMVIRGPRKAGKQGGCSDDTVILVRGPLPVPKTSQRFADASRDSPIQISMLFLNFLECRTKYLAYIQASSDLAFRRYLTDRSLYRIF